MERVSELENKQNVKPSAAAAATRMKPEKFSGSGNDTDFQAFLNEFEACARMNGWKEAEKANQLILCMKEEARVVNFRRATRALTLVWWSLFAKNSACVSFLKPLKLRSKPQRRKVAESLLDLSIDIKLLCGEADPTLSSASLEQFYVDHFIDAIGATLAKVLIRSKRSIPDRALSETLELEALQL